MADCFSDQFFAVKLYCIRILMIDIIPERLKLFLIEIIVQSILLNFGFAAVANHAIQYMLVKNTLNKCMNTFGDVLTAFRQPCQCTAHHVCTISIRHMIIIVNVIILHKITINISALLIRNHNIISTDNQCFPNKVFSGSVCRTFIQIIPNTLLQIGNKVFIAIRRNNCKPVNLLNLAAQSIRIHTVTILVYTKP